MVNCNIASNFIKEYTRMCQANACRTCPLMAQLTEDEIDCIDFLENHPDKSVYIVQRWSNEHPQRTFLTDFIEKYPKAALDENGIPSDLCPYYLGLMPETSFSDCSHYCVQCWNTPINENPKLEVKYD